MKKGILIFVAIVLSITLLAGCSISDKVEKDVKTTDNMVKGVSSDNSIVKIGLGHITSIDKSKDADEDVLAVGQVDTVMAVVGFDEDGKVVKVTIDNAQTKVNFDEDLKVSSNRDDVYKTKVELGDEYGMKGASQIGKEWFEQIAELEKWMIGKSIDEITSMKVVEKDASHPAVPDVAELTSTVTVSVENYLAAVLEAYENAVEVEAGATELGLGNIVTIGKSKDLGDNVLPVAQVDNVIVASAFDKEGKVKGVIIDTAQTKINFDAEGKITTDKDGEFKTKVELGDEYGMKGASQIGKEWFEQIAELEKWMIGKSIDEITSMKVVEKDASHPAVPDVAELTSTVTVSVEDYLAATLKAFENAK